MMKDNEGRVPDLWRMSTYILNENLGHRYVQLCSQIRKAGRASCRKPKEAPSKGIS